MDCYCVNCRLKYKLQKKQNFQTPAGRNFHKQTIGRFLKFCEHSVSSKDMSEPIGEFIFWTYNKRRSKISKINVFAMKISAGWGEEIVLLMKVSVGWGGNCVVYGFSVGWNNVKYIISLEKYLLNMSYINWQKSCLSNML